jgi:hypothetical protein
MAAITITITMVIIDLEQVHCITYIHRIVKMMDNLIITLITTVTVTTITIVHPGIN